MLWILLQALKNNTVELITYSARNVKINILLAYTWNDQIGQ